MRTVLADLRGAVRFVQDGAKVAGNRWDVCKAYTGPPPHGLQAVGQARQGQNRQGSSFGAFTAPAGPQQSGNQAFVGGGQASAGPGATFGRPSAPSSSQVVARFGTPAQILNNARSGQESLPAKVSSFGQASPPAKVASFGQPSAPGWSGPGGQRPQAGFGSGGAAFEQHGQQSSGAWTSASSFGQTSASSFGQPSRGQQFGSSGSAFGMPSHAPAQQQQQQQQAFQPESMPEVTMSVDLPVDVPVDAYGAAAATITAAAASSSLAAPSDQAHSHDGIGITPPVSTYTTRAPDGRLASFKGRQVRYVHEAPHYLRPDGGLERIWFPDGPPPLKAGRADDGPADSAASSDSARAAYLHLAQHGSFQDGLIPETAPRREWVRWDV